MRNPRIFFSGCLIALFLGCTQAPDVFSDDFNYDYLGYSLSKYVNDVGYVDYAGLQNDRARLDLFVRNMERLDPVLYEPWPKQKQLAFWINAYNALTLKAVIDHYPIKSFKELGGVIVTAWDKLEFEVMGELMTLNHIEHKILRKQFNEPRIHMAINCASVGCPPLRAEPFTADELERQLNEQSRAFVNDTEKVGLYTEKKRIEVSKIFKWFGKDFERKYGNQTEFSEYQQPEQAVLHFISLHLDTTLRKMLAANKFEVDYLSYDWSINEQ